MCKNCHVHYFVLKMAVFIHYTLRHFVLNMVVFKLALESVSLDVGLVVEDEPFFLTFILLLSFI